GDRFWCGHFHDTRGLAMANVYAALEVGVARFDASLAGIGGCPHAPGASGNASTEDLAYMLASMGLATGIDMQGLLALRAKVAAPGGDKTRKLPGLGIGFFRTFNRNKKSVVININSPEGHATALRLIGQSDVVIENFRPGLMASLGLDYATLSKQFPQLIYASHKGFLPGPYDKRLALDEVVQMMGGLSYMTGPKGRPLRAGTSVNDIMGGMFGAIGILAALRERERTGRGQEVQSALFENC